MKENSAKATALLDAARAELASKRKQRETRFADTVLGWESEEEAAQAGFPPTVMGWDHPAAQGSSPVDARMAAFIAEEAAASAAERRRLKRIGYGVAAIFALLVGGFIAAGFF